MMKIMKRNRSGDSRRGFTLVELAIVMAVAAVLFTGLWRIMASSSTQMRDQAAADMHRQVIAGVQGYLTSSEGQTLLRAMDATVPANQTCRLPLPNDVGAGFCVGVTTAEVAKYLPVGFTNTTTNSYGQRFQVYIRKDSGAAGATPEAYSFMVLTVIGDTIPDSSGGRISGMIGNDGGFRYSAASGVCGAATLVCGAYGAWSLDPFTVYGSAVTGGRIASRTYRGQFGTADTYWLARMQVPGDTLVGGTGVVNTMNALAAGTDISLGGNTLFGNNTAGTYGGEISDLGHLVLGSATTTDIPLEIENTAGCNDTSTYPAETGYATAPNKCNWSLQVAGGATVTGLLSAFKLYAPNFIYKTTSDRRLKQDIVPIDHALDKVAGLNGYSFEMVGSKEKKYGVIAQEVQKFFPELVLKGAGDYYEVDYMGLIGPLVGAVRDLKEENEKLNKKLDALTKEVDRLRDAKSVSKK